MATSVLPNDASYTSIDDKHLEIFCLIWLDSNANVNETRDTQQKLRSIINYLKKFQDIKQCQQYIEQTSEKDRLVLIVSGQLGRELVPSIYNLRQVISIYVYCMDKKSHEQWASNFAKVKAVVTELDELISRIKEDHQIQKKVEEPLSINICTTSVGAGKSTAGVNGEFVFSQVLIDCLLRLKSAQIDKNELINYCKTQYDGNTNELKNIHEFQKDYLPNKALWWYTREMFFYKILDAALRKQDIHMIFLFRQYISDIHRQLQKYQSKNSLKVYRGQKMTIDEIKILEQSIGQFISINSFFSTSTEYEQALAFLKRSTISKNSERVFFEIDADPKMVTTKPFADISQFSAIPSESEILFMIGSIFRLKSINRNDDQIWIIKMTLCSDDEHELKQVLIHMKQQIGIGETNLRIFGKILLNMGKFDLAEKYLNRLLKQLPSNDPLLGILYEDLGTLASQTGQYDMSVQWHQKSLEFKTKNPSIVKSNINKANKSTGHTNTAPAILKPISNDTSNILIACLDINSTLISSISKYSFKLFTNECTCIAELLSMNKKRVYFVVSSLVGEYIVPLVHQHRCIEQIYIYYSDNNHRNVPWITRFLKVKNCSSNFNSLIKAIDNDILFISSHSSIWSNVELIEKCHTQSLIAPLEKSFVSLDVFQTKYHTRLNQDICIVILHCGDTASFHTTENQRFHFSEFSNVVKCVEYLGTIDVRSAFFIISGDVKSIIKDLRKITMFEQIYAIYFFVSIIQEQELNEKMINYKNIGRLFDNLQLLLNCLTTDIIFYLEQSFYMPTILKVALQKNTKNGKKHLIDEQGSFVAFQLSVNALREAPTSICHNEKLYDRCCELVMDGSHRENAIRILRTETNKIFDWFIDEPFLSAIINSFLREQFPQNLLYMQPILFAIDRYFTQMSSITSSSVVYRVQLIHEQDLKTIKENVEELVAFQTYLLATKDLLTARTVARDAADRGLLVIIFQIEIPTQTQVLELRNNRLMFRFNTIFRIRSIDLAPDHVWYGQLKYAQSEFQFIQKQLQVQVGEQLTWLTLGDYLYALNLFNEAKFYYQYLIDVLPENHQARSLIFNNMGLIFAKLGDNKKALFYYNNAISLLDKISSNTDHASQHIFDETSLQSSETATAIEYNASFDSTAELHVRQQEHEKALECYRKALELETDSLLRVQFEQKIKHILSFKQ